MTKRKNIIVGLFACFLITILTVGCMESNETTDGTEEESLVLLVVMYDDYQTNYTLEDIIHYLENDQDGNKTTRQALQ